MSKKANPPPPVPVRGALALLGLGLAESALAIFQWLQLLTMRGGGTTVCGVSERFNCETVWNTPFASRVHELVGIPVAGLGLLWGIVATVLSVLYLVWRSSGHTVRPAVNGLRLTAAAGVLATALFALVSLSAGVVCPTCLGTYGLVLAFAAVAYKALPGPVLPLAGEWGRALKWTGGFALAGFVALFGPGRATPKDSPAEAQLPQITADPGSLEAYLQGLSPQDRQRVADALAQYRNGKPLPARAPARHRYGPVDAPVKIVEWTDSKCPHCKMMVEALAAMKKRVPEGKMSLEARQYPLDGACNPSMDPRHSDGTGTRCLAAKAQICLEGAPDFWQLREQLFAAQASLRPETIMTIASSGSVSRSQLEACVNSSETAAKLQEDIAYARQHDIHGTPLIVVNGREVPTSVAFLYALVMADGNASAPAFKVLPAPRPMQAHSH
jgi:protein-disulfide isomerase